LLSFFIDCYLLLLIITTRYSTADQLLSIFIYCYLLLLIITTRYSTADQLLLIFIDCCLLLLIVIVTRLFVSSLRGSFFIRSLNQAAISRIGVLPPVLLCCTRCSPISPSTQYACLVGCCKT
jgi:hypothetical protein